MGIEGAMICFWVGISSLITSYLIFFSVFSFQFLGLRKEKGKEDHIQLVVEEARGVLEARDMEGEFLWVVCRMSVIIDFVEDLVIFIKLPQGSPLDLIHVVLFIPNDHIPYKFNIMVRLPSF